MALIRSDGRIALVRKARIATRLYEFGGLWSLPGGMIRGGDCVAEADVASLADASLRSRVLAETGLDTATIRDGGILREIGPLVSSYTTSMGRRHTLILAKRFECPRRDLGSADASVSEVRWSSLPIVWETLAPANTLLLAHAGWTLMNQTDRMRCRSFVGRAAETCSAWAREVGVIEAAVPWAPEPELARWRAGFP